MTFEKSDKKKQTNGYFLVVVPEVIVPKQWLDDQTEEGITETGDKYLLNDEKTDIYNVDS